MARGDKQTNARTITFYGETFASEAEGNRYLQLRDLQERGIICDLERQPTFQLIPAFQTAEGDWENSIVYTADFKYRYTDTLAVWHIEEVKGRAFRDFRLRRVLFRLFLPQYRYHQIDSDQLQRPRSRTRGRPTRRRAAY